MLSLALATPFTVRLVRSAARLAAAGAALLWCGAAQATECAEPYTTDDLLAHLSTIETSLRSGDDASAGSAASAMEAEIACLDQVLPSMFSGRVFRAIGGGIYAGGDTEHGKKWLLTAAEVDQGFDYGLEDLPEDHPVRGAWIDAKMDSSDKAALAKTFKDKWGLYYLDGKKVESPEARLDRFHLFQVENPDDSSAVGWVIEGNAFPEDHLKEAKVADGKPEKTKKKKKKKVKTGTVDEEGYVTAAGTNWPPERIVLIAGGGAIMAAGGVIYALSAGARGNFVEAGSREDLEKYQRQTNSLAVTGMAVGAAGAGTLGFGVLFFIVDGQPVTGVNIRF